MAMTGNWRRVTSFAAIDARAPASDRLLALFAIGAALGVLRAGFDYSLGLPGHHGLETMALLTIARLSSGHRFAATVAAASAAATAMGLGAEVGFAWPAFFLVPALFLDAARGLFAIAGRSALALAALGAAGFALKPLAKYALASAFDAKFGSLAGGLLYPLAMHLGFGFAGSLAGFAMWKSANGFTRR